MRVSYAIVFVSDMQRAISFYRDVLGLPLKFQSPGWTEFATEGATLALHEGEVGPTGKDDPRQASAGTCHPGLAVSDLKAFHKKLLANNVPCVREPEETFGVWLAQYLDPDGLVISISQDRDD
jgi:lactoylglutathione lyase